MHLFPTEARFPDLHQSTLQIFSELQVEMTDCDLCGECHPPELHAQRFSYDPAEMEDA